MLRAILSQDAEGRVHLSRDELHHLVRVRRLRPGEEFLGLLAEQQKWFFCRLADRNGPAVELLREHPQCRESPLQITLGQALIQRDRFEWIVQKAVELGVSRIVPVQTQRTEFRAVAQKQHKLLERWERIICEAVKQCGRSRIPQLGAIQDLRDFLDSETEGPRLYLDEAGGESLKAAIRRHSSTSSWHCLIGPEGGWEDGEREMLRSCSWQPVHLGSRILRAETAAIVTLGILQFERGDLGAAQPLID